MTRLQIIFLSILAGILLGAAWPGTGDFPASLFVAFVPLLMLEDYFFHHQEKYSQRSTFKYFAIAFILFNLISTWWLICVQESTGTRLVSMLGTSIASGLLQTFPFYFFHFVRRKFNKFQGYAAFLLFWLGFEYFHFDWELAWPWFTLGNAFANSPTWIQWYEFTGVFGGSLWLLTVNLLVFFALKKAEYSFRKWKEVRRHIIGICLLIITPIVVSMGRYYTYEEPEGEEIEVLVVQPNIDPYSEKFMRNPFDQIRDMIALTEEKITPSTDFALYPETAIQESTVITVGNRRIGLSGIVESKMKESGSFLLFSTLFATNPQLTVLTGLTSQQIFEDGSKRTSTARTNEFVDFYYDVYNSAASWNQQDEVSFYRKSKLVIGVERLPFSSLLKPIESLAMDLGGASGSLGTQPEAEVFSNSLNGAVAAPLICYESVFGEYVGEFVQKGANVLFLITNDGWWDTSPGYKQHLAFSRLRAIETRRNMARCANTGTSCFINQRGDILQPTEFWEPDVIVGKLKTNIEITFYAKHGDYIGRTSLFIGLLQLLYAFVVHIVNRVRPNKPLEA